MATFKNISTSILPSGKVKLTIGSDFIGLDTAALELVKCSLTPVTPSYYCMEKKWNSIHINRSENTMQIWKTSFNSSTIFIHLYSDDQEELKRVLEKLTTMDTNNITISNIPIPTTIVNTTTPTTITNVAMPSNSVAGSTL